MNRIASVTGSYGYCGPCFCRLTFMPLAQIEVNVTVGSLSLVCWLGGVRPETPHWSVQDSSAVWG